MPSILPVLRSRRERRLEKQKRSENHTRSVILSGGILLSGLVGVLIILSAFAYADVTRDLPSTEILPRLLNPPDGLLLQPTRVYDRTGLHMLATFAPNESPRRYIPISVQNAQHIPEELVDATIAAADPRFENHSGYSLEGLNNFDLHPTIAQKLIDDLVLYNEIPTFTRAIRERLLAAQITAHYGRTQVMEWYLNSADFGNHAYGVDAAAQLYYDRPVDELTLAESAILAAVSQTPALNPLDAPQVAIQRGRELLYVMNDLGLVSPEDAAQALAETPAFRSAPPTPPEVAPAFLNLLLAQIDSQIPRERVERGGMVVISTLDYDLQKNAACVTEVYAARLAGLPEPAEACDTARLLPSLPPAATFAASSASAVILDPRTGQVLAMVGETIQGLETPLVGTHKPGSGMDAFVYLTGFTRGLSPATLTWDVPSAENIQNFDGKYHGAMRLRIALANDYQTPVENLKIQMGIENVKKIASSFGLNINNEVTLLDAASAYGVFGVQGVKFGQYVNDDFTPVTMLRVEGVDHGVMFDWSVSQAQTVVTPAMAYLMTHVLSDEPARWDTWGRQNALEIGRPAGVKPGQTADEKDAWVIGFTPYVSVATWTGVRGENDSVTPRFPAVLWNVLMQTASANQPADGWSAPQGITPITVCDPSGMLPTRECPNLVTEVFLNGSEPTQADNLFREFAINRETGLLATVFTPPELIDTRVYMLVPEDARAWAESAGVEIPPDSYDAIQAPPIKPFANITSPQLFADVKGSVLIMGTASGDDFMYYRVQVGRGLNPQEWIQLGEDAFAPVDGGLLAEWDTTGLSGLYAVQLVVVRADQRVDTAVIQVTIGE
ncbi:MAG TPA: transglycosylase domain-containing protein [Anaerolineales bacterium]|nr:transglycosylase domain-containing protein [Anaerolineales bacterium]HNN12656.1 transglycosylase domain-containing protein [Anaerolineales bacterium]HNO30429.1 transglycosylase domain-containing protein [Anaerolineales bacterium]